MSAYRAIVAGLRASAHRQLGKLEDEAKALGVRAALLGARHDDATREETEQEAMLAEAQLALNAAARSDLSAAKTWLRRAVDRADMARLRSSGRSDKPRLDVLWLASTMTVAMKDELVPDLAKRVDDAAAELAHRREPSLRSYARWFEIYGPLVTPEPTSLLQRVLVNPHAPLQPLLQLGRGTPAAPTAPAAPTQAPH